MVKEYIAEVKQRCLENGLDPQEIPTFSKVSPSELSQIQANYAEVLLIITFFINKYINTSKGIPVLVTVTDNKGTFIEYFGDPSLKDTIVKKTGLQTGIQFTETKAGVSSVMAAIELKQPVQTIGTDHYHHFLHSAACYSVPLFENESLIGTISVMTFIDYAHPMIMTSLKMVVDCIEREIELRQRNRYLNRMNEMMLEKSTIGYIVVESNGKIVNVNTRAQSILSAVQQECNSIHEITPLNQLFSAFKKGECIHQEEIIIQNSNHLICLVDYFPFADGCLIQLHDITEYKKTESYIQNAEKLSILGQLAAGVAHEIKNPLTTLKGFMQLLQQNRFDLSYTPVMLNEIERINQITNEFLVLSRPTVLSKDWYDIRTLLVEIEVIFSSLAMPKNIEIVKTFSDIPLTFCDANQLKQVFINIIKNSTEAVAQNGTIYLEVRPYDENHILVRVVDNGAGFPSHVLAKAGQPFITTKENGNGLGVMICKKIIETIHSGQLQMYNHENLGAVVDIILPNHINASKT